MTALAAAPPPRLLACEAFADPRLPAVSPATMDGPTFDYVASMQMPFEQLRHAAGQIAGVLVLATVTRQGTAGHPMLDLADTARREASEAIGTCRPPPPAEHHHRHLSLAAREIAAALDAARRMLRGGDDAALDTVLVPLRAGYRELQWAAGALPGFEVVAFSQGCCARHTQASAPPQSGRMIV